MRKLVAIRKISQGFFFALFVYILWSTTYPLAGCIPPETFFTTDPLLMVFTSIAERVVLPGLIFSAAMIVMTLIVGRFFCGWVCPLGSLIDCVGAIGRRAQVGDAANRAARKAKWYLLGAITLASLVGAQIAWVFDPVVTAARFVSMNLIPFVTSAADAAFRFLIRDMGLAAQCYGLYRALKSSVLGIDARFFSHAAAIGIFFAVIVGAAIFMRRSWCRVLCPLGACYALFARFSLLRRTVHECTACLRCKPECRMGAITDGARYVKGECVLCMDCIYGCPQHITQFRFPRITADRSTAGSKGTQGGLSRRQFFALTACLVASLGFRWGQRRATGRTVLRPPAALPEGAFVDRCVRCGNCMKVCITNGLQPTLFETGLDGIWTPKLVPVIGYCEYNCVLCGGVCPTGAIRRLTVDEKHRTRLGVAEIDRTLCIPWAKNEQCIVCQEHCPVPEKAIRLREDAAGGKKILQPAIDRQLCVGCGICENKCPVRPMRAVHVAPL